MPPGTEQWRRNLYLAWFVQIISLTGFGFVFPFLPLFIQELGVTDPNELQLWTGLISAGPALGMGLMAPVWGLLADRFGNRVMILRAMAAGAIVNVLHAYSTTVVMVFALRVVQGLFAGTVSATAALVATGTPEHKLAFALGFQSSSTFIGIFLGPLIGGIAAELFGYRVSFLVGAFVLLVGFLLTVIFIRDPQRSVVPAVADHGSTSRSTTRSSPLAEFTSPMYIWGFILLFVLRFSRTLTVPFLALHIQDLRATSDGTSAAVGIVSAAVGLVTAVGGLTLTRSIGRQHRATFITRLFLVSAVVSAPVFLMQNTVPFAMTFVAFSYFLGGIEPLLQASLAELTPVTRRGLLFGVQTTVSNVGWFIAPLAGSAIAITLSIGHVFLAKSAALSFAFLFSWIWNRHNNRPIDTIETHTFLTKK